VVAAVALPGAASEVPAKPNVASMAAELAAAVTRNQVAPRRRASRPVLMSVSSRT
jgi:hypothetical protein